MSRRIPLRALTSLAALAGLLLAASPAAAQFGKNKVQYRQFDWQIYRSPHFDVYYYPEEEQLLQKVVSFAESAYDHLSQEFDYQIQQSTTLIFYETHSAFEQNNIILNFIPEGTGAFATPVRTRMVLPVDLPDPELMELILHELTHIFEFNILCQGNTAKCVAANPPTWFMEGLASYMAKDESARDKMYLRDAVVNDRIPPLTRVNLQGFFAYRFGHAVFEYIEERWGKEALRDFLIEMRNTIGGRVGRAVERTFQMEPDDFDAEFRRWLRRKYLPELVETGEPGDFGRLFRARPGIASQEISPAASPSGDLVAAFSTSRGDVDVVLFDTKERTLLRNLTKGYDSDIQYFAVQELTLGRKMGRDLAFSPDGNTLALFARRDRGRDLVLIDVLKGGRRRMISMDVEQQLSPAWSPDGKRVAFAGHQGGQFDIFILDLETERLTNLTNDDVFDGAPTFSPDGGSIVMSSVVGGFSKLFRVDLADPSQRFQLTTGESNDTDPVYSPDGERLYFTSDLTGADNIFSLDLAGGNVRQHTNSVTGCFMPTVLAGPEGKDRLVYTAFWKGRFDLYRLDVDDPITPARFIQPGADVGVAPVRADELPRFEPTIEVNLDESKKDTYRGFKFFLEDAGGTVGVSDDQTLISQAVISFSDYLGDRRIIGVFQSVESFQNFDVYYTNLRRRLQWQVHLFDDRDFFIGVDRTTGFLERGRALFKQTGAIGSIIYPFDTTHRFEAGVGFIFREIDFQSFAFDPVLGGFVPVIRPRRDEFPIVQAAFVGDTAAFAPWGPVSGRRWRIGGSYAPDLDESGALTSSVNLDFRQYFSLSQRSNFAFRLVAVATEGNFASPVYIGGLDTIRGFDFRSLVGDRAFFANFELRFPLIDQFVTPVLSFQGIRGNIFLDVGGAWFSEFEDFDFYNSDESRLEDGVASYGYGFTIRLFGIDLNFDFAKQYDFKTSEGGYESSFWIGRRF